MVEASDVVIGARRWSYVVLFLLSAGCAWTCTWMLGIFFQSDDPFASDYALFGFFLFVSLWGARSALRRAVMSPKIIFSATHLSIFVGGDKRTWAWTEIETAELKTFKTHFVVLKLKTTDRTRGWWLGWLRYVSLDYPFELTAHDLHDRILSHLVIVPKAENFPPSKPAN